MFDDFRRPLHSTRRWLVVAGLITVAAAHLPVIAPHLAEAPYLGELFVLLASACVLLAATLISFDARAAYRLAEFTCAAALAGYVATRLVAFPMLADDVGNWGEPLGVVSLVAEAVVVLVARRILHSEARRASIGAPSH